MPGRALPQTQATQDAGQQAEEDVDAMYARIHAQLETKQQAKLKCKCKEQGCKCKKKGCNGTRPSTRPSRAAV